MMTTGFNLLDLMTAPPLLRRILRALLRHQALIEDQIWTEIARTSDEMPIDRAVMESALSDLQRRGWLTREVRGDQVTYTIRLHRGDRRLSEARLAAGDLIEQVDDNPRYRAELAELTLTAVPAAFGRADVLDGLMQRGGKRTLPRNIWDKLSSDSPEEDRQPPRTDESRAGRKTGTDVLNLF
ncbi:MAG: hypothetical protein ACUVS2_02240 [Candidatus Flexifilum sp.]